MHIVLPINAQCRLHEQKKYRYNRGDFGMPDTHPLHMDLHFDMSGQ